MINNYHVALSFSINIGCNLKCPYCIVTDQSKAGFQECKIWSQIGLLENIVKKITKPDSITWVGGEPGLWSYPLVSRLLEIIDDTYGKDEQIVVCTNGLFMKKFPFLINDTRFVFVYHITDPENYDVSKDPYVKLKNVSTAIVVTKDLQNNYELLKKYNDECSYVDWQLCDFPGKESTEIYKKYAFDRTQPTALTSEVTPMNVGENPSCYNTGLTVTDRSIEIYNCCSFIQSSKKIITYENYNDYNFNLINKHLIPMTQVVNNCKHCQRFINSIVFGEKNV